jgi:hypothetical protein
MSSIGASSRRTAFVSGTSTEQREFSEIARRITTMMIIIKMVIIIMIIIILI